MSRREFNSIISRADRDCRRIVEREVCAVLPAGWEMHLAVGWGLTLVDDAGRTVFGRYEDVPKRFPKGVRRALLLADDYCETFGADNSVIYSAAR